MLRAVISYLRIGNLAIVDRAEIEPGEGLNVLTGETGAGKSLLIDSLQFLSGARGSTELIRSGEEKLTVQAIVFAPASIRPLLEELSIEAEGSEGEPVELVIRREISTNGRGRAQVNGTIVTIRDLVRTLEDLMEVHGQNQSISKVGGRSHREMLDEWAGNQRLLAQSRELYDEWTRSRDELDRIRAAASNRAQRTDMLQFQIRELEQASISEDEKEQLVSERSILAHSNDLAEATNLALEWISEGDDSAVSLLGRSNERIAPLARKVELLDPIDRELNELLIRLEELAREIASISSDLRNDPERLEEVESRLALIERLERKYAMSSSELVAHLSTLRSELAELEDWEASVDSGAQREKKAFEEWQAVAAEISARRKAAAGELSRAIETQLHELAMASTRVKLEVSTSSRKDSRLSIEDEPVAFGPEGYDQVTMFVAPNPGEPFKTIEKTASGGELARIQLAVAAALAERQSGATSTTLIFDEIDAGVGGRVADVVAKKLARLSHRFQVICVTHLPQIAAAGSRHFSVAKEIEGSRTRATIRVLDDEAERVEEVARMLAGESITESARTHARELLGLATPKTRRSSRPAAPANR